MTAMNLLITQYFQKESKKILFRFRLKKRIIQKINYLSKSGLHIFINLVYIIY